MRRGSPGLLSGGAGVAGVADAAGVARVVEEITAGYDARYSAALRTVLAHAHAPPVRSLLAGPLGTGRAAGGLRRSGSCEELAAHVALAADRRSGARARGAEGGAQRRLSAGRTLGGADGPAFVATERVRSCESL